MKKIDELGSRGDGTILSKSILFITWNFPPKKGGMENLIHDIFVNLSRMFSIDVIAPASPQPQYAHLYRPKYKSFIYFIIFSFLKGIQLVNKNKHHFVFGGSLTVVPVIVSLKYIFRMKCVVYVHGLDIIYQNKFYQKMLQICLPKVDGFICNSHNTKQLLHQRCKQAKNITVIPPGIQGIDSFSANLRPHPRKYLFFIGRLTERKGIREFIEKSFVHIASEHSDIDLIIAGDEPKEAMYHKVGYKAKIIEVIRENNLEQRIKLLGWVSDHEKNILYQYCECLVFPIIQIKNDIEGFGMVAIEAGMLGRPTVAFDTGGVKDAVLNYRSGILVEQNDYNRMTKMIGKILSEEIKFPNIKHDIKEAFDWENLLEEYSNIFR